MKLPQYRLLKISASRKGASIVAEWVDVVTCGECKWLRYCETEEMELTLDCDHPDGGGVPRSEEWFCADGERKDDE